MTEDRPSKLASHDRTQVLPILTGPSLPEAGMYRMPFTTPQEMPVTDDGTSFQLTAELAQFRATASFRRVGGEGWAGDDGYSVDVMGPAEFVSEVIGDAAGRFLDSEER